MTVDVDVSQFGLDDGWRAAKAHTEVGDLARQVDAVDENIAVGDLLCVVCQL